MGGVTRPSRPARTAPRGRCGPADFRGPGQHQRAAAAVAIDPLQRQRLQHRLAAAGADRLGRDRVGVLHHRVLRGVGAQHLLLGRIGARLADRLEPHRLGLLQHDLHLGDRDLLGRIHPPLDRRRARHLAAQIAHGEIVGRLREAHIGRRQRQEHVRPARRRLEIDAARHQHRLLGHEHVLEQQRARDRAAHAERIPVADDGDAVGIGRNREIERVAARSPFSPSARSVHSTP